MSRILTPFTSDGGFSTTGNVSAGNVLVVGTIGPAFNSASPAPSLTGFDSVNSINVSASGNVTGSRLLGSTASVSGNVAAGNLTTSGEIIAAGNITGGNITTAGSNGNITGVNAISVVTVSAVGNLNLAPAGNVVLNNRYINGLQQPAQDSDAATKIYVDTLVSSGINYHQPVYAATTADLATTTGGTVSYNQPNGVGNGVGSYLQTSTAFTFVDAANVQTVGTRILVKNEANAAWNGIYGWANTTAIVRTTDADQYGPINSDQMSVNDYFFTTNGTVNAGTAFVVSAPTGPIIFGTSNISFSIFSQSPVYSANTQAGLVLNGTIFSAQTDNNTTAFDGGGNIVVKASAQLTTPNIGAATGTSLSTTGTITGSRLLGSVVSASGNVVVGDLSITGNSIVTAGNLGITTQGTNSVNLTTTSLNVYTANLTLPALQVANTGQSRIFSPVTNANSGVLEIVGSSDGNILLPTQTGTMLHISGQQGVATRIISDSASSYTVYAGRRFNGNVAAPTNVLSGEILARFSGNPYVSSPNNGGFTPLGTARMEISATENQNLTNQGSQISFVTTPTGSNVIATAMTVTNSLVSAAGNITAGNLLTAGNVSASGNITGSYITGGLLSATGNVIGASFNSSPGNNLYLRVTNGTVTLVDATNQLSIPAGIDLRGITRLYNSNNIIQGSINANLGEISVAGNVTGNYFLGDGSQLTGIISSYGNANVVANLAALGSNPVSTTGNVTAGNVLFGTGIVSGTGNISGNVIAATTVNSTTVSATGNVTGNYFLGNGSQLTGVIATDVGTLGNLSVTGNANVGNVNSAGIVSATGNVTGGNLLTTGLISATSTITSAANIIGGNITTVGLISATGNITSGNLLTTGLISATSTITSAANIAGGNLLTAGLISATSTITSAANVVGGNITTAGLVSATGTVTGSSLLGAVVSASGNVTGGNLLTAGLISATGNITTANYFLGNGALLSGINVAASSSKISNGGSYANIPASNANVSIGVGASSNVVAVFYDSGVNFTGLTSASGNVTGGNLLTAGLISATSNVTGGNILTAGLISATSTITSAANVIGGNISTAGLVTATGNVTGGNISTAGLVSSTGNVTGGNILTAGIVSSTGNLLTNANLSVSGNATIVGSLNVQGNVTFIGSNVITTNDLYIELANNQSTYANINNAGFAVGPTGNVLTYWQYQNASNAWSTNVGISATANVTSGNLVTAGLITATGNVTGGNILTAGIMSSTGNVTVGNILTAGLMSSTGNVTGGNILTAGLISATSTITSAANIAGGNLLTAGLISATSTITSAANIAGGNILTAGLMSSTGNVTSGNILTGGIISATGNISGSYILGNGSQLTGIITSVSNVVNGNSNINISAAAANITMAVSGVGNVVVIAPTGEYVTGVVSATGNIFGGNVILPVNGQLTTTPGSNGNLMIDPDGSGNVNILGNVSITGNIVGNYYFGNGSQLTGVIATDVGTLGNLSVTGNANVGNVNSAGIVSSTGNVIGGNILTAGLISATGNITGNYFLGNGSQLTGIVAGSPISLVNGTTNITTALNGNANVTIAGTSNVVVWATTGEYVTGNVYSTNTIFVPYGVSQAPTDLTLISLTNALIA